MKIHKLLLIGGTLSLSLAGFGATWTQDGVTFGTIVSDGETYVCITSCGASSSVTFPSEINGHKVTRIGRTSYTCKTNIVSVTIPEGVTTIGWQAFEGCSELTSITIPDSVTSIRGGAFNGCRGLANPEGFVIVKGMLFDYVGSGLSVTIPASVTNISDYAFSGCIDLTSITIPDSVTSIGYCAFANCRGLTLIKIPESVKSIEWDAFTGCDGLASITIPANVDSIGAYAFSCRNLTSAVIPACAFGHLPSIFLECLRRVEIVDGVVNIDEAAFKDCNFLASITMPDCVLSIGPEAFSGCSGLTSIMIPDGVTSIGSGAFYGCAGLSEITIPYGVTSIDDRTFSACAGLTSITIPDSVTSIGLRAFGNCDGLMSITIPNSVKRIDEYAFYGSGNIASVTMPGWVQAGVVFGDSTNLTSVVFGDGASEICGTALTGCGRIASVKIPESVVTIEEGAFDGCANVQKVELQSCRVAKERTLRELFPDAYASLTDVTFGAGVTELAEGFFDGCVGLMASIRNWREIGEQVGISGLWVVNGWALTYCGPTDESLTIPSSVTNMREDAFVGCTEMRSVELCSVRTAAEMTLKEIFPDSYTNLTTLILGSDITELAEGFFDGCVGLMENTSNWREIGEQVEIKGLWTANGWVMGYYGTTDEIVKIPEGVSRIADRAFKGESSLKGVTIPSSVTNMGKNAFVDCGEVRSVELRSAHVAATMTLKDIFPDSYMSLTNLVLGAEIGAVADGFFDGCLALVSVDGKDWRGLGVRLGKKGLWVENGWALGFFGTASAYDAVPEGVIGIAAHAFDGQSDLENVSLPSSLRSIGPRAFARCTSLERLDLPSGVTRIGDAAFQDCTWLQELTLPSGLRHLGGLAFANCTSLSALACAEGVVEIGEGAFSNCWRMTSASLPASLQAVGKRAFFGCDRLTSMTLPSHIKPVGELLPDVASNLTSIAIADGETTLVPNLFVDCKSLRRVSFPSSIVEISDGAFAGCELLTEIAIPKGVVHIGDGAFAGCSGLSELVLPSAVTNIGAEAFAGLSKVTKLVLPTSLQRLGANAFVGCSNIVEAEIKCDLKGLANANLLHRWSFDGDLSDSVGGQTAVAVGGVLTDGRRYTVLDDASQVSYLDLGEWSFPTSGTPATADLWATRNSPEDNSQIFSLNVTLGESDLGSWNVTMSWDGQLESREARPNAQGIVDAGACGYSTLAECTVGQECHIAITLEPVDENMWVISVYQQDVETGATIASGVIPMFLQYPLTNDMKMSLSLAKSKTTSEESMKGSYNEVRVWNHALSEEELAQNAVAGADTLLLIPPSLTDIFPDIKRVLPDSYTKITNVVLGTGLRIVPVGTFDGCSSLKSVEIPEGVTAIGENAFRGTSLTSVNIPASVRAIGAGAFAENDSLTEVTLPTALQRMGGGIFSDCGSLKRIALPPSLTEIPNDTFAGCAALSEVAIPDGVVRIGNKAFDGCSSVTRIVLPSSLVEISNGAFAGCSGLSELNLPSTVTNIGTSAFEGCVGLSELVLPSGLTAIGAQAFAGLDKLTAVAIQPSVRTLGEGAFAACPNIQTVSLPGNVATVSNVFPNAYATSLNSAAVTGTGGDLIEDLFAGCRALKSVEIPTCVTNIGARAFRDCARLEPFALWGGLVTIGKEAFYGVQTLQSVTIPDSVTSVGIRAFGGCSNIRSVTFPVGVCTLAFAFPDAANKITSVTFTGSASAIPDGCLKNCAALTSVVIPSSVTTIGAGAFSGVGLLDEVKLPTALQEIGDETFKNCASLKSLVIPKGVTKLGASIFNGCAALKSVYYLTNIAPTTETTTYLGTPSDLTSYVIKKSKGWDGISSSMSLPKSWPAENGRTIDFWKISPPTVAGDDGATVTGDAETGFVVTPSEGATAVVVTIPSGVDAAKVTVVVAPETQRVTPNGAAIRVMRGEADITDYLDIPPADVSGVIDLNAATVKEEIAKEPLDAAKGAVIDFASPSKPSLTTAPTREGLVYRLKEGATL